MNSNPKPRNTFRRRACIELLGNSPLMLTELRWRIWLAEWKSQKTKYVCARSASYRRSIERSIRLWEDQNYIRTFELDTPISYGMAAKLAIFTALERGQLSAPTPAKSIRLYFSGHWCSIIVIGSRNIAVNLGAVFTGERSRYNLATTSNRHYKVSAIALSEVPWEILKAENAETINPILELPEDSKRRRWQYDWQSLSERAETYAPEGVALSLLHSTPGRIGPYMLTGEQIKAGKRAHHRH